MYAETSIKSIVRHNMWSCIQNHSGKRFFSGFHLFLASRFAGDGFHLSKLGVNDKWIVPVDYDINEVTALRYLMQEKGINWCAKYGCIASVIKNYNPKTISSIFLDFFGNLSGSETQKITSSILSSMVNHNYILSITFSSGRDEFHSQPDRDSMVDSLVPRGNILQRIYYRNLNFAMTTVSYCIGSCKLTHNYREPVDLR